MLKRHEVQALLKAGHGPTEVSRLAGVSYAWRRRGAQTKTPGCPSDFREARADAAEQPRRSGPPSERGGTGDVPDVSTEVRGVQFAGERCPRASRSSALRRTGVSAGT